MPWPLLALGDGLSLLFAILGASGALKEAGYLKAGPIAIFNTIRVISGLTSVAKAMASGPDGSGHFAAPSALFSLTLSLVPLMINGPTPIKILTIVEYYMGLAATIMMIASIWIRSSTALSYGYVILEGGNCPVLLNNGNCNSVQDWNQYAGCGWWNTSSTRVQFIYSAFNKNMTFITAAEAYMSIVLCFGLIWGVALAILLPINLYTYLFKPSKPLIKGYTLWYFGHPGGQGAGRNKVISYVLNLKVTFILLFSLVSLICHIESESPSRLRSSPPTFAILDAFGPALQGVNGSANASWTDCFTVQLPTDDNGFLYQYWIDHKTVPETYLGLT